MPRLIVVHRRGKCPCPCPDMDSRSCPFGSEEEIVPYPAWHADGQPSRSGQMTQPFIIPPRRCLDPLEPAEQTWRFGNVGAALWMRSRAPLVS